jgi:N-acetylneuraminate synthase
VAQTKKPIIISTGAATLREVAQAIDVASNEGADDITLLVCTSSYPARPADAHISRIPALTSMFGFNVGLSDHTEGIGVSVAATALGARLIEKHVTLSKDPNGVDADFSITVDELRTMVIEIGRASESIGFSHVWNTENENESRRLRPSIYVNENVTAGTLISEANIRIARPSGGIEPRHFGSLIGKRFAEDAKYGDPLQWHHLA